MTTMTKSAADAALDSLVTLDRILRARQQDLEKCEAQRKELRAEVDRLQGRIYGSIRLNDPDVCDLYSQGGEYVGDEEG